MEKTNKKTIVILSAFYQPFEGGAEQYVRKVVDILKSRYNFIVLTSCLKRSLPKREQYGGVVIKRLGLGLKIDKWFFPFLAPWACFFIKKDIVHAVLESYAGLALCFYKFLGGRDKTLLTLQSGRVNMPAWLFRAIHRAPDKIQAISQALAQRAKGFRAKDVAVVPNGIDIEIFRHIDISRVPHRIISVAHLKKVKGLDYLIKAMPAVLKDFPDAEFVLVGDGPERKNLENLAHSLGLGGRVKFKGALPHSQVAQELAKAEVFVLPSLAEGFGIAVVEAMAAGLPVIASRVGGITDIIQHNHNGLLIEPESPQAIADAVIKLFTNPGLAQTLTQNARRNTNRYSWQNISEKINQLYLTLLK